MHIPGLSHHPFLDEVCDGMRVIPAQPTQLPSVSDMDAVSKEVGWPLPEPYVQFNLNFGAVYLEVKEEIWPTASIGEVAPYWQIAMYGWKLFGVARDVPEHLDVRMALRDFRSRMPEYSSLLPIFQWAGGGNFMTCLDRDGMLRECDLAAGEVEEPLQVTFDDFVVERAKELQGYMIEMAGIRGLG